MRFSIDGDVLTGFEIPAEFRGDAITPFSLPSGDEMLNTAAPAALPLSEAA